MKKDDATDGPTDRHPLAGLLPRALLRLEVAESRATLHFDQVHTEVAPHPGSAIRGALGEELRRTACTAPGTDCAACVDRLRCPQGMLFTPSSAEAGPRRPPPPWATGFLWDPDGRSAQAGFWTYGPHAAFLMTWVRRAFQATAGEGRIDGIPPAPVRWQGDGAPLPLSRRLDRSVPEGPVRVDLPLPLALKVDGRASDEAPGLATLVTAARRRARLLVQAAGAGPEGDWPPLHVPDVAPTDLRLEPVRIRRWSRRQGRAMWLSGVTGFLVYPAVPPDALAWLRVAEVLGVGNHTPMAFGRIRLNPQGPNRSRSG